VIKGCSNHGCVVRGETPGMHTNSICRCVQIDSREDRITVCGKRVGPLMEFDQRRNIRNWLCHGGLRDILALERKESPESFPDEAVRHLSRAACYCQMSGPDVEENRHVESCMVGRAQEHLGMKVTKRALCGGKK